MVDINLVAENLAELLSNTVNMTSVFYDIFLNPQPMDVELKMFDDNNRLITVTIPNRAKDRVTPYQGEGSPEGVIEAPIGSTYVDTTTSTVYYKVSGEPTDPNGWNAVLSQRLMELFLRTYLISRGYITSADLNTLLYDSITEGTISGSGREIIATDERYGVVKLDRKTLEQDGTLKVIGILDKNENVPERISHEVWTGSESEYRQLYLAGEMQSNTIYLLKDSGQVLLGNIQVTRNCFPSAMSEDLALGQSGTSYVAPADGWFIIDKNLGSTSSFIKLKNMSTGFESSAGVGGTISCPALKGETVEVTYSADGGTNLFKFIYAASNTVTYTN